MSTTQAARMLVIGSKPVKPGPGQRRLRYDTGKYRRSLVGKQCHAFSGTVAVWCFRGKDAEGPYYGLMCITKE
jgi:hypothetical protein